MEIQEILIIHSHYVHHYEVKRNTELVNIKALLLGK